MNISETCIRRPVMTTLITASLIVFGIFGYRLLSVAATLPASDTVLRSRTCRLRQYSLPMHRLLFRHATLAPNASSSAVCQ